MSEYIRLILYPVQTEERHQAMERAADLAGGCGGADVDHLEPDSLTAVRLGGELHHGL